MLLFLLIILFSIPAIFSLFPSGFYYSHDGIFHLVRLAHFYKELTLGQFPVRWANDLAYGFGYPIFNYFYPLFYYCGSLLHLIGFGFSDSAKIILIAATVGSALIFYLFLRCYFSPLPSFTGAIFYLYTPYRFLAMYVNGSFGIVLSFFFVPLIFLCVNKFLKSRKNIFLPLFSLSLAFLIVSHNVSALIFFPLIFLYSLFLIITEKVGRKIVLHLALAALLGFGLSAFFILPAFIESKYVNLGYRNSVNYTEHWPTIKQLIYSPWGYGYSGVGDKDNLSFQVGIAQWMAIISSVILLIYKLINHQNIYQKNYLLSFFMVMIFLFSLFFMLPLSNFIWKIFPIIKQIQFPWRLLAVTMFCSAFFSGWLISQKPKVWLAIPLIFLVIIANRNHLRNMEGRNYPEKKYLSDESFFYGSTDIGWESLPIWVKKPYYRFTSSKFEIHNIKVAKLIPRKKEKLRIETEGNDKSKLILNYYYFPSWQAKIDDKLTSIFPSENGLIELNLPSGKHTVSLELISTNIQKVANFLSLFSFVIWVNLLLI